LVLVLTDVQGSTRLWQDEPVAMDAAMRLHHQILHGAVATHGGWRPTDQGEGDSVFAAFRSAGAAVRAVAQIQRDLAATAWPTSVGLKARIGVHVGEVVERDGNLYGDPVNRCARIRGLASGGQTLLSSPVFELVRDRLPDGLTVRCLGEHQMKDLTRPELIHQLDIDGLPTSFPPLRSLDRVRHNLPGQPSTFVGREAELSELVVLLETERLVTIIGFGGMGKTRLALQVAAELADRYVDGVWLVDLSVLTDCAQVPAAIASVLSIAESGQGPAEAVLDGLADKQLLLVLDNLEQVIECAAFIAELHSRCPGVQILGTSREPLHLRAEHEFSVVPMSTPPLEELWGEHIERLGTYESVQLFVDRAVSVSRHFTITNETAPAVATICARLDGHPLAIELAAARLKILTPQALLDRLDSALTFLTGGGRDHPRRHQTLQATIAWSYDLLPPEEQVLLNRLSVFAGPVTLEAVEAICSQADVDWNHPLDVLDGMTALVDKSLLRASPPDLTGEQRFSLLGTIRDFAAARLVAAGGPGSLADRHAEWYLPRGHVTSNFDARLEDATLVRIAGDLLELDAAFAHLVGTGAPLLSFPWVFFEHLTRAGQLTKCMHMVRTVLERHPEPAPETQLLLHQLAWSLRASGQSEDANTVWQHMLAQAEALDLPEHVAFALAWVLTGASRREDVLTETARIEQVIDRLDPQTRQDRFPEVLSHAYAAMGSQLLFVDPARSLQYARLGLDLAFNHASPHVIGIAHATAARALQGSGDLVGARQQLDHIDLTQAGHLGQFRRASVLAQSAQLHLCEGDIDAAQAEATRALVVAAEIGQGCHAADLVRLDVGHLRGDHEEVLDQAMRIMPGFSSQAELRRGQLGWRAGRAARHLGRTEQARELVTGAVQDLHRGEIHALPDVLAVRLEAARLDADETATQRALDEILERLPDGARPVGLGDGTSG